MQNDIEAVFDCQLRIRDGLGLTWSDYYAVLFKNSILKCYSNKKLLRDLWNPSVMEKLKDLFEARLIPLNKVWPDIPTED